MCILFIIGSLFCDFESVLHHSSLLLISLRNSFRAEYKCPSSPMKSRYGHSFRITCTSFLYYFISSFFSIIMPCLNALLFSFNLFSRYSNVSQYWSYPSSLSFEYLIKLTSSAGYSIGLPTQIRTSDTSESTRNSFSSIIIVANITTEMTQLNCTLNIVATRDEGRCTSCLIWVEIDKIVWVPNTSAQEFS
uniref:Ig-like domain-containing protein n=1 Tax=Heterorhabditis bacteriophora TaxID=37862 RepID=A0A1I7WHJ9_HETBA